MRPAPLAREERARPGSTAASPFNPKTYWETRLSSNRGLRGVGFTSLGHSYNRWLYRIRRQVFLKGVRSLPVDWPAANVLDVGSGTGFYVQLWDEVGVGSVMGSDLTSVAVGQLRKRFAARDFLELDITAPLNGLVSREFDVVSAFDMLFHIVNDESYRTALANIHSLLRPGGWFLFSDQLLHSPTRRNIHMVERSKEYVLAVLEETGFEVIQIRPVFVLMNYPVDAKIRAQQFLWKVMTYPVRKIGFLTEPLGAALGAALYPLEALLTSLLREGPSTEMVICQKCPRPRSNEKPAAANSE